MIGYATVGTNDFETALAFYDALFASVGVDRLWKHGHMAAWGRARTEPALCIATPFDGKPAHRDRCHHALYPDEARRCLRA